MITRLRVRNFKSLRQIDITLRPLNVLVGANMSGKSNILDVFGFLHQVFLPQAGTQGVSFAIAQRGGVNEVLWKGGDDKLIGISLEGVDPTEPGTKFEYLIELLAGAGDFVGVQNETLRLLKDGREIDLLSLERGYAKFSNIDGKDAGSSGQSGLSAMQYAHPGWDGYRFFEWVRRWRFYHLVPPAMKQPSLMSLGQVLMPNGDNLSAWLMWLQANSPQAFARLNEVLRDLFPDVTQVRTIPMPDGKVYLAATEKGLKRPTAVWQASDGFLMLTALLSLIYVPPELSGSLFCVEEPENHLHPRLLETVMQLLRQARDEAVTAGQSLSQIIATTQSPYLVDQLSLEEIIWVEKRNGETKIQRPSDKAHLKRLVESKELGLGDLVFTGVLGQDQ